MLQFRLTLGSELGGIVIFRRLVASLCLLIAAPALALLAVGLRLIDDGPARRLCRKGADKPEVFY